MLDFVNSIEGDLKKFEEIFSQEVKVKFLEFKNQELFQRIENMIVSKDSEVFVRMDSVS